MARYVGPVCRLCRREGIKLFLKGTKCETAKCTLEKRAAPPGQHGQTRTKLSEYGVQLREKQRLKRMWGMLEQQFKNYFRKAARQKGVTGETLLQSLELRLDNVVYRLGFSASRLGARQAILHGHVHVNGHKVNRPSFGLKIGDQIQIANRPNVMELAKLNLEKTASRPTLAWLKLNREGLKGEIVSIPTREEISVPVNERLIVELYSK
ncbi:MAG: 30S ribosomal protein S4 [Chlamydiae bacterium]|nr:30S ribosomal protein S4 [Chlamydiota bacterium]MBI3266306.1 30S ribosomal protein S4 [Chlamydiota bacterium]